MKKCSFCGKDNHDDARFCANCGRTFVVKEIRKKLGKSFEILGYITIGLGIFAFIFSLVDLIVNRNGFVAYPLLIIEYLMLALIGLAFLYSHKIKSKTLSLFTSQALIAHAMIFFTTLWANTVFFDFSITFRVFMLMLLAYLASGFILYHLKHPLGDKILKYYRLITAGVVVIYTFIVMLYLFIFGFRSVTIAFGTLSVFFYFLSLSVMFVLPIIDRTIDIVDQQDIEEHKEHPEVA